MEKSQVNVFRFKLTFVAWNNFGIKIRHKLLRNMSWNGEVKDDVTYQNSNFSMCYSFPVLIMVLVTDAFTYYYMVLYVKFMMSSARIYFVIWRYIHMIYVMHKWILNNVYMQTSNTSPIKYKSRGAKTPPKMLDLWRPRRPKLTNLTQRH